MDILSSLDLKAPDSVKLRSVSPQIVNNAASFHTSTPNYIGAIVVQLPPSPGATMIGMRLEGYEYKTGQGAWSVLVGGYAYPSNNTWLEYAAHALQPQVPVGFKVAGVPTVRLGCLVADPTTRVVILGDVDSVWQYPGFRVAEAQFTYSGWSQQWDTGWTITGAVLDLSPYANIVSIPLQGQFAISAPPAIGTGAVGTSTKLAREDHTHTGPTSSDLSGKVSKSGDTMSGALTVPSLGTPAIAAPGGTIDVGYARITTVGDPEGPLEASNRQYVDTKDSAHVSAGDPHVQYIKMRRAVDHGYDWDTLTKEGQWILAPTDTGTPPEPSKYWVVEVYNYSPDWTMQRAYYPFTFGTAPLIYERGKVTVLADKAETEDGEPTPFVQSWTAWRRSEAKWLMDSHVAAADPHPVYIDYADTKLTQLVTPTAPTGDANTRWVNSDTGVEYRWDTTQSTWVQIGSGGGVSDHGALTGLADDDHALYTPYEIVTGAGAPGTSNQRAGKIVLRKNVSQGAGLGYVDKQGDSMSGPLTLYGDPSSDLHAATKAYADLGGFYRFSAPINTDGWYRIAVNGPMVSGSASGGDRAFGRFRVYDHTSWRHNFVEFTASASFGQVTLNVTDMNIFSTQTLSNVRLVSGGTYDGCAVEVYLTNMTGASVYCEMQSSRFASGFDPVSFTPGSIPSGMSVKRQAALSQMNATIVPTLLNGWTGSANEAFRYRKTAGGLVTAGGIVRTGTAITSTIYTFPVGFRPTFDLYFSALIFNNVPGWGQVKTDGSLGIQSTAAGATNSWIILNLNWHTDT